ncbi:FCD domain-containing protein, partial [Stenotrophomonas maltophilia]
VFGEHSDIYEAVRDQDAEGARLAMRRHLEGSRDRLFEGRLLDLSLR